jgi:transcriptional regulator with XRE-family HTH domain
MEIPDNDNMTPSESVLLTRNQVARRLGISVSTVRRMEHAELVPIVVDGKHLFTAADVERFAQRSAGELSAAAFIAFNQGKSPIEFVIENKISYERIERIHAAWVRMSSSIVLTAPSPSALHIWKKFAEVEKLTYPMLSAALQLIISIPELRSRWRRTCKQMQSGNKDAQQE